VTKKIGAFDTGNSYICNLTENQPEHFLVPEMDLGKFSQCLVMRTLVLC